MNKRPSCKAVAQLSCVLLGFAGIAFASPDALQSCRGLADPTQRLACFDHAAATPAPAVAATAPAPSRPMSTQDAVQQFGLPEKTVAAQEVAAGVRAADATKITAHIVSVSQAGDHREVFTLDNAQKWSQLEAEADLMAKNGDLVTISRGMLGSYWLQLQSGRGCKVTRKR